MAGPLKAPGDPNMTLLMNPFPADTTVMLFPLKTGFLSKWDLEGSAEIDERSILSNRSSYDDISPLLLKHLSVDNYGITSCLYLGVCIEDFDPLRGHKQIDLSSRRSFPVRALRSRRETTRKEQREATG